MFAIKTKKENKVKKDKKRDTDNTNSQFMTIPKQQNMNYRFRAVAKCIRCGDRETCFGCVEV